MNEQTFSVITHLYKLTALLETGQEIVTNTVNLNLLALIVRAEFDSLISELDEIISKLENGEVENPEFNLQNWSSWAHKFKTGWADDEKYWRANGLISMGKGLNEKDIKLFEDYLHEHRRTFRQLPIRNQYHLEFIEDRKAIAKKLEKVDTLCRTQFKGIGLKKGNTNRSLRSMRIPKVEAMFNIDATIKYVSRISHLAKNDWANQNNLDLLWYNLLDHPYLKRNFELSSKQRKEPKEKARPEMFFSKKFVGFIITTLRNKVYFWESSNHKVVLTALGEDKTSTMKNYIKNDTSEIAYGYDEETKNEILKVYEQTLKSIPDEERIEQFEKRMSKLFSGHP